MILIVDDRPENIFALENTLKINNFEVDTAESGEEALKKVLKNNYSLIILDVQMPGMDGFEVAEIILGHNKSKHTPIIFLSATSKEKKFIERGFATGAIDYITKPVDPDLLLLRVKSLYSFSQQKTELANIKNNLLKEIAEKQIYQDKLANKVQELNIILEAMPLIAFTLNTEGKIEYVNNYWKENKLGTDNFPGMIDKSENWKQEWINDFQKGVEFNENVTLQIPNEGLQHHVLKIVPVKQNNEILKWIGTLTNIHSQKIMNETLEHKVIERTEDLIIKNRELKNSNEELQQFTWVMSHDLKEPIRKILTFANLIHDRYLIEEQKGKKEIERIIASADRMAHLIDDLMGYTKLSDAPIFESTNITEIVEQIISDYELVIQEKQAKIIYSKLCIVDAMPSQLRQILQNLISNALKFSKTNESPIIEITSQRIASCDFAAKVKKDGDFCRLEVKDNGIGFDEIYLEKIFQVFQRLSNGHSIEGTGIGLAIAKKSIEKHHGLITATSKLDEGSTFIIILPIKQKHKEE